MLYGSHFHKPDDSIPTLTQKTITVTSKQELDQFMSLKQLSKDLTNPELAMTDLTDIEIDDTMDMDLARIGLIEAVGVPSEILNNPQGSLKTAIETALISTEKYLRKLEDGDNK